MSNDDMDYKTRFANGSEVLQSLFENGKSPLSDNFIRWKMWAQWRDYVGDFAADQTEPVGFYRGTLWVWVRHSTWMQQMLFVKKEMINNINHKLNRQFLRDIQFTLDRRDVPVGAAQVAVLQKNIDQIKKG